MQNGIGILIAILLITNVVTGLSLVRVLWLKMLWKMEATTISQFAATESAVCDYDRGKLVKLRLAIDNALGSSVSKPT